MLNLFMTITAVQMGLLIFTIAMLFIAPKVGNLLGSVLKFTLPISVVLTSLFYYSTIVMPVVIIALAVYYYYNLFTVVAE